MATLLSPRYRTAPLLPWSSFVVIMFVFYFANSWTPRLFVESGMTEQHGIVGGLMLTMGGTFGSLLYGVLITGWDERLTLMAFTVLSALTLVLFITTTSMPLLAFSSGVVVGMLINGCIAGLYTAAPMIHEPGIRATNVGRARVMLGPIVVDALLDSPAALPWRSRGRRPRGPGPHPAAPLRGAVDQRGGCVPLRTSCGSTADVARTASHVASIAMLGMLTYQHNAG